MKHYRLQTIVRFDVVIFTNEICSTIHHAVVASLTILEIKPESLNEALVKSPKDMLLFSKKARQVDFKPKTLKQYRETKPTEYVQLGKLQPDLFTEELIAKVHELPALRLRLALP